MKQKLIVGWYIKMSTKRRSDKLNVVFNHQFMSQQVCSISNCLLIFVGGKKPEDRTTVEPVLRVVSVSLYVCLCFVASLGVLASCLLLVFVCVYRHVGQADLSTFLSILLFRRRFLNTIMLHTYITLNYKVVWWRNG